MNSRIETARRRGRWIGCWALVTFAALQLAALALPSGESPQGTRFRDSGQSGVPTLEESIVQWQVQHITHAHDPHDVVCFGDSSCLMGVMPQVIAERTGARVWNFGTLGWLSTDGHAALLRLYLTNHPPPKLAIYHVSTYPLIASRREIEEISYYAAFRRWISAEPADATFAWLPSTRLHARVATGLSEWFFKAEDRTRFLATPRGPFPSDDELGRVLRETHGYLTEATPPLTADAWQRLAATQSEQYARPKLAADCVAGLQRIAELAEAARFELWLTMVPLPEVFRDPATDRAFAELESCLRALMASQRRVRIVTPLLRYYPTEQFGTIYHLTRAGADCNSEELGAWIKGSASTR